jgi:NAD(P)-dependent dehydrogenase (short-subunit alcohol dehydrogenase family)
MTKSMAEKVAIVTGAGRGIGEATARLFMAEGARVVLVARMAREVEGIARELGSQSHAVVADIGDEADVLRVFAETQKRFGSVNILVNNAGIFKSASVESLTAADWDKVIRVNLRGSFLCAREAFRRMKEAGHGGSIVNIASLAGIRGVEKFPGTSAYAASKHGVVGLTEVLAVEGRPCGIRVNCVAPGAVDTKMLRDGAPWFKASTKPEDIAKTILFLSDEAQSSKLTGTILEIHCNV